MKKIVIALFAAMLCITASAQLRTSRTFFKTEGRGTEWIIRAGLSIDNMAGMKTDNEYGDKASFGSALGFDVDFGFNKYIGQSNLYWGMELGIGTRGASSKYEDYGETYKEKGISYNVKYSPFTIGYKFPVTDAIKIDPHFGAYASYDFAKDEDNFYPDKDFDAGIQIGAGLWYGRINLDFMYQRGFVDAFDYIGGKTSNFLIRIGYAF